MFTLFITGCQILGQYRGPLFLHSQHTEWDQKPKYGHLEEEGLNHSTNESQTNFVSAKIILFQLQVQLKHGSVLQEEYLKLTFIVREHSSVKQLKAGVM